MGRQRKPVEENDATGEMTSMIDVVFLLLIFFIVMPFKTSEGKMETALPRDTGQSSAQSDQEELDKIDVKMKVLKGVTLDISGNSGVEIKINGKVCSVPQLFPRLQQLSTSLKGGLAAPVELNADENVPFYFVLRALNASKLNGFTNIKFAAPPTLKFGQKPRNK